MVHPEYESSSKREKAVHLSCQTSVSTEEGQECVANKKSSTSSCDEDSITIPSQRKTREISNETDSKMTGAAELLGEGKKSMRRCYKNNKRKVDVLNSVVHKKEFTSDTIVPLSSVEINGVELLDNIQDEINIPHELNNIDVLVASNDINISEILKVPIENNIEYESDTKTTLYSDNLNICDILVKNPSKNGSISSRVDVTLSDKLLNENFVLSGRNSSDMTIENESVALSAGKEMLHLQFPAMSFEQSLSKSFKNNACTVLLQDSCDDIQKCFSSDNINLPEAPLPKLVKKDVSNSRERRIFIRKNCKSRAVKGIAGSSKNPGLRVQSKIRTTKYSLSEAKVILHDIEDSLVNINNLEEKEKYTEIDSKERLDKPLKKCKNKSNILKGKTLGTKKPHTENTKVVAIAHPTVEEAKSFKNGKLGHIGSNSLEEPKPFLEEQNSLTDAEAYKIPSIALEILSNDAVKENALNKAKKVNASVEAINENLSNKPKKENASNESEKVKESNKTNKEYASNKTKYENVSYESKKENASNKAGKENTSYESKIENVSNKVEKGNVSIETKKENASNKAPKENVSEKVKKENALNRTKNGNTSNKAKKEYASNKAKNLNVSNKTKKENASNKAKKEIALIETKKENKCSITGKQTRLTFEKIVNKKSLNNNLKKGVFKNSSKLGLRDRPPNINKTRPKSKVKSISSESIFKTQGKDFVKSSKSLSKNSKCLKNKSALENKETEEAALSQCEATQLLHTNKQLQSLQEISSPQIAGAVSINEETLLNEENTESEENCTIKNVIPDIGPFLEIKATNMSKEVTGTGYHQTKDMDEDAVVCTKPHKNGIEKKKALKHFGKAKQTLGKVTNKIGILQTNKNRLKTKTKEVCSTNKSKNLNKTKTNTSIPNKGITKLKKKKVSTEKTIEDNNTATIKTKSDFTVDCTNEFSVKSFNAENTCSQNVVFLNKRKKKNFSGKLTNDENETENFTYKESIFDNENKALLLNSVDLDIDKLLSDETVSNEEVKDNLMENEHQLDENGKIGASNRTTLSSALKDSEDKFNPEQEAPNPSSGLGKNDISNSENNGHLIKDCSLERESDQTFSENKTVVDYQALSVNKSPISSIGRVFGGRRRTLPKLHVRMEIEVDQQCCGHWFPTRKSYFLHLVEHSTESINCLHSTKLYDMDMQKCTICLTWLNYRKMKRHMRKDHGIINCIQKQNIVTIVPNIIEKKVNKVMETSANSVVQTNYEVQEKIQLADFNNPIMKNSEKEPVGRIQLDRPCPMSKKRKSDANEENDRIICDLRNDPKFLKTSLTISSMEDLPLHLKPIIRIPKYKALPKNCLPKKKRIRGRPLGAFKVKVHNDNEGKVISDYKLPSLNAVSKEKLSNSAEMEDHSIPGIIDSALIDKSSMLNKIQKTKISSVEIQRNKSSKFGKIFDAVLKTSENSSFLESGKFNPLPLSERNDNKTITSTPLSTRSRNSLNSLKTDNNEDYVPGNKTIKSKRHSRQSIDLPPQAIMRAKPLGRISIRGRPTKQAVRARKKDLRRRRCGLHSSETSDASSETSYSSSSDYDSNYLDDDQKENEENVPTVELELFTISSGNEEVSILLIDPKNPNFKVFASMDAIFVGDSALSDVTNQLGYVTDKNNVVYVDPGHFLFPKIGNFENEDSKLPNTQRRRRNVTKITKFIVNDGLTSLVSSINKCITSKGNGVAPKESCKEKREKLPDKENLAEGKGNLTTDVKDLTDVVKDLTDVVKGNLADVVEQNLTEIKEYIPNKESLLDVAKDLIEVESSSLLKKISKKVCNDENVQPVDEKMSPCKKSSSPVVRSMISISTKSSAVKKPENNSLNNSDCAAHVDAGVPYEDLNVLSIKSLSDVKLHNQNKTLNRIIIKSNSMKRKIIVKSNSQGSKSSVEQQPVRDPRIIVIKTSSKMTEVKNNEMKTYSANEIKFEKNLKHVDTELENGKNKSKFLNMKELETGNYTFKINEEIKMCGGRNKSPNVQVKSSILSSPVKDNSVKNVISLEEAIATLAPPSMDETVIQTLSLNTSHVNEGLNSKDEYGSYKLLADSSHTNLCYSYDSLHFGGSDVQKIPSYSDKDCINESMQTLDEDFTPVIPSSGKCFPGDKISDTDHFHISPVKSSSLETVKVMGESHVVVATAQILPFETLEGGLCLEDVLEEKSYFSTNEVIGAINTENTIDKEGNKTIPNRNEVLIDRKETNPDINKVLKNEKEIIPDENEVLIDGKEIIHEENKVIDEKKVIDVENEVINDSIAAINDGIEANNNGNEAIDNENEIINNEIETINNENEVINKKNEDGQSSVLNEIKEISSVQKHKNYHQLTKDVSDNSIIISDSSSSDSEISLGGYEDLPVNTDDVVKGSSSSSIWDTPLLFSPKKMNSNSNYEIDLEGNEKLIKIEDPTSEDNLLGIPLSQIPDFLSPSKASILSCVSDSSKFSTKSPIQFSPNTLSKILSPEARGKSTPLRMPALKSVVKAKSNTKRKSLTYNPSPNKSFIKESSSTNLSWCKNKELLKDLKEKNDCLQPKLETSKTITKLLRKDTEGITKGQHLNVKRKRCRKTKPSFDNATLADSNSKLNLTKFADSLKVGVIENPIETVSSEKKSLKMKISLKNLPTSEKAFSSHSHKKKKKLLKKAKREKERNSRVKGKYGDQAFSGTSNDKFFEAEEKLDFGNLSGSAGNFSNNSGNLSRNPCLNLSSTPIKNEPLLEAMSSDNEQPKQIVLKQFDSIIHKRMTPSKLNLGSPKKAFHLTYEDSFNLESCTDLTSMKINVRESDPNVEKGNVPSHSLSNDFNAALGTSPSPRIWRGRGAKLKAQILIQDQQFGVTDSNVIQDQPFSVTDLKVIQESPKIKIESPEPEEKLINKTPLNQRVDDRHWHSRGAKLKAKVMISDHQKGISNSIVKDEEVTFVPSSSKRSSFSPKTGKVKTEDIRSYFSTDDPNSSATTLKTSPFISPTLKSLLSKSPSSLPLVKSPLFQSLNSSSGSFKSPVVSSPKSFSTNPIAVINTYTKSKKVRRKTKKSDSKEDIRNFLSKKRKPKFDPRDQPANKRTRLAEQLLHANEVNSSLNTFEGFETYSRFSGLRSKILLRFVDVLDTTTWFNCDRYPLPIDQLCDWDEDQLNVYLFEKG